jgi:hypothetical protein
MRSLIRRRRRKIIERALFCSLDGRTNEMAGMKLLFSGIAIGSRGDGLHSQSLSEVCGQGGLWRHRAEGAIGEKHGHVFHH